MRTKHRAKLPVVGRVLILFMAANFNMFGNCLGVLDSCADMDFVEQDYQTLPINPPEVYAATPENFGNTTFTISDLNAPSPDVEGIFFSFSDINSQVNYLLG